MIALFRRRATQILASLLLCSIAACGGEGSGDDAGSARRAPADSTTERHPERPAEREPWRDTTGCSRAYHGTINTTIGITMRLCRKGETLAGSYRYVKVGKDIEIQGHVDRKGEFVIYEWGDGGERKQTGNWHGRFVGDSVLEGTWSTVKGDRSMPFRLALVGSATPVAGSRETFSGSWVYRKEGYSFALDLRYRGDSLVGHHCAVTKNATRVDCSSDEEDDRALAEPDGSFHHPSIVGRVQGNVATVSFESSYGTDSLGNPIRGRATMTLDGDRIAWRITDFTSGDFYLPMEATLRRTSPDAKGN